MLPFPRRNYKRKCGGFCVNIGKKGVLMKKDRLVIRHDDGWASIKVGALRPSKVFETQAEAIDYTRKLAQKDRVEMRIQGRNGKFRQSDSYGHDPKNIKG